MSKHGRLIDADALWMDIIHSMDVCDDILEIIERQPTIEPERKKGKWQRIVVNKYASYLYKCDKCGERSFRDSNFCPNCGADMRQEGEQNDR